MFVISDENDRCSSLLMKTTNVCHFLGSQSHFPLNGGLFITFTVSVLIFFPMVTLGICQLFYSFSLFFTLCSPAYSFLFFDDNLYKCIAVLQCFVLASALRLSFRVLSHVRNPVCILRFKLLFLFSHMHQQATVGSNVTFDLLV